MVRQVSDEEIKAARREVREWMAMRPDITAAHIAQHTTLSASTVRAWIAGGFPGGREVVSQILSAVREAKCGMILTPGGHKSVALMIDETKPIERIERCGTFYETQTVKRIGEVLDYCAAQRAIGVITGEYGIGKTEGIKAWRRATAGKVESVVFEFDEFSSTNKVDFVRVMARQFGLAHDVGSQNGGLVFRDLCGYLRKRPALLIFDQCETVRARVCQVIRQLWDRTNDAGVAVALLAAPILLARLMSGKMADLGALTSRIGIWAPLAGLTRQETAAILKCEGIVEMDEAAFDLCWKAIGGSMRRLMRAIGLLKAKHGGKPVTEKTVTGVAAHLWGVGLERAA